jgi:hypothetical protein
MLPFARVAALLPCVFVRSDTLALAIRATFIKVKRARSAERGAILLPPLGRHLAVQNKPRILDYLPSGCRERAAME